MSYPGGRERTNYPERDCPTCGRVMPACCLPAHARLHGDPRLRLSVPLEEQAEIVRLYNRPRSSLRKVSAQTFWSQSVVRDVVIANGVALRPVGSSFPRISADERLKRAQLYGRGLSLEEVARACGVTREAVRRTLAELEVPMRPRGSNLRWQRGRSTGAEAP